MEIVTRRIADLKHVEGNTRIHSAKQIREYSRSIEMFGQFRPMIIDENNVVLAGNGLLQALKQLGRETADCYVMSGLTANEKKKLMLADNKIFQLGEDDTFAFEETISSLGGDINIPGYGADILKSLTSDLKSIDAALNTDTTAEKDSKTSSDADKKKVITCPKCGHKFSREKKSCREKQNVPVGTEVVRA